jgi:hypothetical protein
MKIAIDLNDVLRAYTRNFAKVFKQEYDHTFDSETIEITTNNLEKVFPFENKTEYNRFVYQDYPFELFGKCDAMTKETPASLTLWTNRIKDIDTEEPIDVMIVSAMEYGLSIQSSYFFLSKLGCKVREVYFPTDSLTIWDKCDVLVTANPKLLENKPEGKISIKIVADYNSENVADETFTNVCDFFADLNNVEKYLKKDE